MPGTLSPVVFTGPMATGKTAVGRSFAARRGLTFVDTDRRITQRHGPIPSIFEAEGEDGFRRLEADVVREVLAGGGPGVVVSLGGGAVLNAGTRALLKAARVVFLDADLATVLPRLNAGASRPMLAGDAGERWATLYEQRRPLYLEVAECVVDTRGRTVRQVVDEVERMLGLNDSNERRTTGHGT
ncbi:shikimate kinase [Arthrobacter crusticola]|uniref:Shikimate kinase n=1 Tax=Arthrobacter crusticola TaxID=2547960 RepID=A0A4R5U2G9_9MICC|nr:shikimate kinase [Arthrobacter crusticola]TDK27851.1 shikimate kinase [Arthrobacter crusticola]